MTRKIPEHLRPLYDELTVTFKDGRFSNDAGQTFKTAKEAIEHNKVVDGLVDNFSSFTPAKTKPFRERVKVKPKKPQQQTLNLDLNFYDEINKIKTSLSGSTQPPAKVRTSSGLNYIMGFDDE